MGWFVKLELFEGLGMTLRRLDCFVSLLEDLKTCWITPQEQSLLLRCPHHSAHLQRPPFLKPGLRSRSPGPLSSSSPAASARVLANPSITTKPTPA